LLLWNLVLTEAAESGDNRHPGHGVSGNGHSN
jgi:hypothetical protein